MIGLMIETVVMAFVIGGVVGAIIALQLNSGMKQVPVKIEHDRSHPRRRIR